MFAPNVRGSTGYGKAFVQLDKAERRMDAVTDLAWAARALVNDHNADPARIALYGASYGGFMVLSAMTRYPELWAAGIEVVGIANFVTYLQNTSAFRRKVMEAEYGSLARNRTFLEGISPINHVDRIIAPLMVIHGANDSRVPVNEAEQIVTALQRRNVLVEYLRYEDEGHGLTKMENKLDAYPKMAAFLDRHIGA